LIQLPRPLPQPRCDLFGGFISEVCDDFKRLDPQLKPVTQVLIRTGQVAGPESYRCQAPRELTADCSVDVPLNSLGLFVGVIGRIKCSHLWAE
jgi:hypothetical protein